ncbi:MAG: ABC transporter ATP-binding protein [Christensenellales bacterium]
MLKIKNLCKSFGEKKAVDNVSIEIADGEIYGFIGHNGAGKTTTIKACTGIMPFDSGEIEIDGASIKDSPLLCKSKIAYIPDNPDLYEFMTGNQYINFVADIFAVPTEKRKQIASEIAKTFELSNDLDKSIASYSHGMKQKLAVITAWVHSPKLIIMDEPFVGLDPKASHSLKLMMRDFCDKGGSIFFSTHVLEVAEKLCDKVAIIKNGQIVASGKMQDVKGDKSLEKVFLDLEDGEKNV